MKKNSYMNSQNILSEGFLTRLLKKMGVGKSEREKIKNDPELNKTLDKMNKGVGEYEKHISKVLGRKIKFQRYTLD